jgi:hypothetical protein
LAKLLPPAYRGVYGDLEKASAATIVSYRDAQGSTS